MGSPGIGVTRVESILLSKLGKKIFFYLSLLYKTEQSPQKYLYRCGYLFNGEGHCLLLIFSFGRLGRKEGDLYAIRVSGVWVGVVLGLLTRLCREWMGAEGLEPKYRFHFLGVGHLYVNLAIAGKDSIFLS